jgi:hypothetical protein
LKESFEKELLDKIGFMQITPKDPPAKYHVDSSFTTATKYVSFASTSLY